VITDQDLWIGDRSATAHMTPYQNGLENLKNVNNRGVITKGNGTKELIAVMADVIGTVAVKNEVKKVRIQEVTILKNGRFNLCSLHQMLKKDGNLLEATNI
jgi:hypothetical protein